MCNIHKGQEILHVCSFLAITNVNNTNELQNNE